MLAQTIGKGAKGRSPQKNMQLLLDNLGQGIIIPEVDKYYVFVYNAKTPRIRYDAHPFVYVTAIFNWGFTGYNFHWEGSRSYSWNEVVSNIYEVPESELNFVQTYPIAKIKTS